jgi:sugar/nucleoside kinase (ribokinase family)
MTTKKSVVIIGSATIDTIVQNNQENTKIGGVVSYAGLAFRRQKIDTKVITNIGEEDQDVCDFFIRNKISLLRGHTPTTTRFINVYINDQRHQMVPVTASPIEITPFADAIIKTSHIHLGSLFPTDIDPEQIKLLATYHGHISLDVQGLVREIRDGRVYPEVSQHLIPFLTLSHSIKADAKEMDLILAYLQLSLNQFQQKYKINEILVTTGKQGGYLVTADGRTIRYNAYPAKGIKDKTGSGDMFFAVYLAHHLHGHKDISTSLSQAAKTTAVYLEENIMPFLKRIESRDK